MVEKYVWRLKLVIKKQRYKQAAKVIYYFFIYGNMVILWTLLAAVALLLLIFSRPFTNAMFLVIAFSHESPLSFLSQYSGEISLCHGHFWSSLVSSWYSIFQFLCSKCSLRSNSALFNLHFVWIIITLIILNNFLNCFTKIHLCSQVNQNHLLRDSCLFSACWDKWKEIAHWSQVLALLF